MNKVKFINYLFKENFGKSKMYQLDVFNFREIKIKTLGSSKKITEDILTEDVLTVKLNRMINIINSWKDTYVDNRVLDGFEFKILVEYENKELNSAVYGKNKFPLNFSDLSEMIGEI